METMTATPTVETEEKKEYARFTLLIYYTHRASEANGGCKRQIFRDDITQFQFENRGISVKGQHPLAVLFKKYLELEPMAYTAIFYDNSKPVGRQIVHKRIIRKGVVQEYENFLEDYYDRRTGQPHPPRKP